MSHFQKIAFIVGGMLLGAATLLASSSRRSRTGRPPIDKLTNDLKHAWSGYHTP